MTHASDGFRCGRAIFNPFSGKNQNPLISAQTIPPVGFGVFMSPFYVYYAAAPAAPQTNNIVNAQTLGGAGNLPLVAGTGTTSVLFPPVTGVTCTKADYARNIQYTSNGNETSNIVVTGYDMYGQLQTEAYSPQNQTLQGKKTFLFVSQVAMTGATIGTINVGFGNIFGLPYAITDIGQVGVKWAGVLAGDASTVVVADGTLPVTTTTGDVRGTVTPSSNANGARNLFVDLKIINPDTSVGAYGVTPA